jgi:hypothetical protein
MMRPIRFLFMAMAVNILPGTSVAEDYQDCRSRCAAERDTRNMDCPSPYDDTESGEARRQCLRVSQTAYMDCLRVCPAPPPPASFGEQVSPPATGY